MLELKTSKVNSSIVLFRCPKCESDIEASLGFSRMYLMCPSCRKTIKCPTFEEPSPREAKESEEPAAPAESGDSKPPFKALVLLANVVRGLVFVFWACLTLSCIVQADFSGMRLGSCLAAFAALMLVSRSATSWSSGKLMPGIRWFVISVATVGMSGMMLTMHVAARMHGMLEGL